MLKNIGRLENIVRKEIIKVKMSELKSDINFFENLIIYKKNEKIKIYDRKCDHAGGKLISKGSETFCPIHMWKFNPSNGLYENGFKKKELNYSIKKDFLEINNFLYKPKISNTKKN